MWANITWDEETREARFSLIRNDGSHCQTEFYKNCYPVYEAGFIQLMSDNNDVLITWSGPYLYVKLQQVRPSEY
jgi:hypothetical protein